MPRDGSGNYTAPAGQPVVTGTTISSTIFNTLVADMVAAMTASLTRDGQTTPSANLPMGGFKHTGVADGTSRNQYATVGQTQDNAQSLVGSVAGTNTITGSLAPAITSYTNGQTVVLIPANDNTGAVTLALNGLSAKGVFKLNGAALVATDLRATEPAVLVFATTYNGWQLLNPNIIPVASVTGLGTLATQSGTFSGTHSGTSSGTNTGDQTITLTGDVTGSGTGSFATTLSAAQVLTRLLTVDGSGSGLDADLLDGLSSAAFATASHNHAASEVTSGTLVEARGGTGNGSGVARNISAKTGTAKTLSTSAASGGSDGDIWYQY